MPPEIWRLIICFCIDEPYSLRLCSRKMKNMIDSFTVEENELYLLTRSKEIIYYPLKLIIFGLDEFPGWSVSKNICTWRDYARLLSYRDEECRELGGVCPEIVKIDDEKLKRFYTAYFGID